MSENLKLGQLIEDGREAHRDAVHVAVAPVVAAEKLSPGDHVGMNERGEATEAADHIGIVDPFLKKNVKQGQRVWLYLYPGSITSLRHEWEHPAFKTPAKVSEPVKFVAYDESHAWLLKYADELGMPYDQLIDGAAAHVDSLRRGGYGEYIVDGGKYQGVDVPDEFWRHYEEVTGEKVDLSHRSTFFSCSC